MWLVLAFVSAIFLGFYDTSKKASLRDNAVLPVLFLNTVFSTLIFSPFLLDYICGFGWFSGTLLDTAPFGDGAFSGDGAFARGTQTLDIQPLPESLCSPLAARTFSNSLSYSELGAAALAVQAHLLVVLKAFIVLSSWICGYFGLKHLPLTIVGPINATRPVLVLVGATLIFGENLNLYQWTGVLLTIFSIFLMSRAGKKENIDFKSNRWIWCLAGAVLMGAVSGLYDKFIVKSLSPMFVQSWFNFYQMVIMAVICGLLWYPKRHQSTPFTWRWSIPLISLFICVADFAYFSSLHDSESMISVVSLVRRSSVIVSFACAALIFKERNLRTKIVDLGLILLGMAFIWVGTN
jgi:transporter family protein